MADTTVDNAEVQKLLDWRNELKKIVAEQEARFQVGKSRWNFWYYCSMYGAVLFSASSALGNLCTAYAPASTIRPAAETYL
jgi:hypothetical protein